MWVTHRFSLFNLGRKWIFPRLPHGKKQKTKLSAFKKRQQTKKICLWHRNKSQHTAMSVDCQVSRGGLVMTPDQYHCMREHKSPKSIRHNCLNEQHWVQQWAKTFSNQQEMWIHSESETPMVCHYNKIVFSSTQAAFESMMNGDSELRGLLFLQRQWTPLFWLHNPALIKGVRGTQRLSSSHVCWQRGPGVPRLSASHLRVIDNLAVPRNDNDSTL